MTEPRGVFGIVAAERKRQSHHKEKLPGVEGHQHFVIEHTITVWVAGAFHRLLEDMRHIAASLRSSGPLVPTMSEIASIKFVRLPCRLISLAPQMPL